MQKETKSLVKGVVFLSVMASIPVIVPSLGAVVVYLTVLDHTPGFFFAVFAGLILLELISSYLKSSKIQTIRADLQESNYEILLLFIFWIMVAAYLLITSIPLLYILYRGLADSNVILITGVVIILLRCAAFLAITHKGFKKVEKKKRGVPVKFIYGDLLNYLYVMVIYLMYMIYFTTGFLYKHESWQGIETFIALVVLSLILFVPLRVLSFFEYMHTLSVKNMKQFAKALFPLVWIAITTSLYFYAISILPEIEIIMGPS